MAVAELRLVRLAHSGGRMCTTRHFPKRNLARCASTSCLIVGAPITLLVFVTSVAWAAPPQNVYRGYTGEPRPRQEVATILLGEVEWLRFDSTRVEREDAEVVELLPGRYELEWSMKFKVGIHIEPKEWIRFSIPDTVRLEASRSYALHGNRVTTYDKELRADYQLYFWAEDVKSHAVITGFDKGSKAALDNRAVRNFKSMDQMRFLSAAYAGDLITVRRFLDAGFDVNSSDRRNRTALMCAAWGNHAQVVDLLLENRADPCAKWIPEGATALMVAASSKSDRAVERLLAHLPACVNEEGHSGLTALMCAAAADATEIMESLLAAGANARAEDKIGRTALAYATSRKAKDLLRIAGTNAGETLKK